jgi:DNA invertase Pin-like site-specific DNA recombinase
MVFGYCRISTPSQSIDRQVRNILAAYPTAKIVKEVYTGTTTARPNWEKLRKQLRAGDTVIFDSVSRMSRNADEGVTLYETLYTEGINLCFLKEPSINTAVYKEAMAQRVDMTGNYIADEYLKATNRVLMYLARQQVKAAFEQSEKEVTDNHQRTKEGIETARRAGKQIGAVKGKSLTTKKSMAAKEAIKKHNKAFGGTLSDPETISLCGISRNSFYKYKRELIDELNQ